MKKFGVVELFSGIGSQAKALKNINADYEILATCEWDMQSFTAYDYIHHGPSLHPKVINLNKEEILFELDKYTLSLDGKQPVNKNYVKGFNLKLLKAIYSAILKNNNKVSINDLNGIDLPNNIDLMTYSFPCQDLSNVGSFHGYNKGIDRNSGSRSSLLWEVERLLFERKQAQMSLPKFLMLENVPSLLAKRHEINFKQWQNELESLGYSNHIYKLMTTDFGLPQTRPRLIMISMQTNFNKKSMSKFNNFFLKHNLESAQYLKSIEVFENDLSNFLKLDYKNTTLFEEALAMQPNDTVSRKEIWDNNPKIIESQNGAICLKNVATITTKQDRHPNSGNIYFDYSGNTKSKYRFLTPRECFLLMGFDEEDYEVLIKNNLPYRARTPFFYRDKLLRLAGNSIPVKVLEQVFKQIFELDRM